MRTAAVPWSAPSETRSTGGEAPVGAGGRTYVLPWGYPAGMGIAFQASLLDADDEVVPRPLAGAVRRVQLTQGAWIDALPAWVRGADALFARLVDVVPWRAERRTMYDRLVDVPRLLCLYGESDPLPDPALVEIKAALDTYYGPELGEGFATAGMCLYRDGRDSVAWHGDRIGRSATDDTVVAIVSLGAPRALLLRPRSGGRALRYELGHGDLLVMGGSCQRTWEHAVPKTSRPVGPRLSVQFRPRGVF
jgi:alkylated DNA repair dioxygenase AlkB